MPSRSMVNFPKLLIQALMRLPGVPPESDVVEAMSNGTGSRLTLDHGRFDRALFERLRKKVLHYVEEFMLSSQRALELRITTPRVFVHSTCTAAKPVDYLRELLVIGLLELGLEIYVNCDMSYIFADFDVASQAETWKTSYGRGFLYERALETSAQQRLTFWRTGDPVPSEPLTYVKTTYNNKPIPQEDLVSRGVDLVVDGNDIWAPHHPPPSSALQRWFLREGTSCHEFQRPAQQVLAMLDSGDLWNCDHAPGSHLCPNLHEAASLWYEGLRVLPALRAWRGYRNEEAHQRLVGDAWDYMHTVPFHPEFVQKYVTIATNSRQFMDAYRSIILRTERRAEFNQWAGPQILQDAADPLKLLADCGRQLRKVLVQHPCACGHSRGSVLAVLHLLSGETNEGVELSQIHGLLLYGFECASQIVGEKFEQELLKLREDDHPNAADAPWPALTLARQRLAEVLFPTAANSSLEFLSVTTMSALAGDAATSQSQLLEAWSNIQRVLRSLEMEDYELKGFLQELFIAQDVALPWADLSRRLRRRRRGLLGQLASLGT
ncbi:unnamed protein product [Durusdinium trenchii]